jgi:serine/threonine protein kinase/tetratricopeptide (TPR) repeat protein
MPGTVRSRPPRTAKGIATMSDEEIFERVLEASPEEQAALLDRLCVGRPGLRARIERLVCDIASEDDASGPPPEDSGSRSLGEGPGSTLSGRYTLVERIGEGGMGEVWVAKQSEPVKRKVALKLIRADRVSRSALARFAAERQALALMDHPNVAKVFDGGVTASGRPFLVMELVPGRPLTTFCDEARLGIRERLELFVQVCRAVQHAHQKGVVHRDLKPSNILVTLVDGEPTPKVIDFGIAKAVSGRLVEDAHSTQFGAAVGTYEYMAPEQTGVSTDDVDTRSDVYALGVVLYELLTGLRPFDSKRLGKAALDEVVRVIREADPPSLSSRLSSDESLPSAAAVRGLDPRRLLSLIRGELDWIVLRCLEKDRNRRYDSASGLGRDVERFLNDEPVEARPVSTAYRLRKLIRKHRGTATAALLIVVTLALGIVGTAYGLLEARRTSGAERLARIDAQKQQKRAEEQTRIAAAVRDFLQKKLLAQADTAVQADALIKIGEPSGRAKRDPTIRELLDRAAEELSEPHIDRNFPEQPVLQAELLETVGNAYQGVGEYEKAILLLTRAAALRKAHQGAEAAETLGTLSNLGGAYLRAGNAAEAVRLCERIRDARIRLFGVEHPDTIKTLQNLGQFYWNVGRFTEAITLLEQAAAAKEKTLGRDDPDTVLTLSSLAEAYRLGGRGQDAVRLFEKVRDAQLKTRGAQHPSTLTTLHGLAVAHATTGNMNEAVKLLEQVRDAQVKLQGPDHPDTLITLTSLAASYGKTGRIPQEVVLLEKLRDAHVKKHGADHPVTLIAITNLATGYKRSGKGDQALRLFEQAAAGVEKLDFQHQEASRIVYSAAEAYESRKQFAKAEPWWRKWAAVVARTDGPSSWRHTFALESLAGNLVNQRKSADAEAVLREALSIRRATKPDAWETLHTQSMLGTVLVRAKKYDAAEALLPQAYEGLKAREKSLPPGRADYLIVPLQWLVELHTATNKPELVKKWQAELAKYSTPVKGATKLKG